jgi:hypothetical protein
MFLFLIQTAFDRIIRLPCGYNQNRKKKSIPLVGKISIFFPTEKNQFFGICLAKKDNQFIETLKE